jgi:ribosomal protein S18 acetylase RimI-like enzyme
MTHASSLSSDRRLYERGMTTEVACWEHFARATESAQVVRAPGLAAAIFPSGPERSVYNNAVLERDLAPAGRTAAIAAMEDAYAAAGVDDFAAWVHETDLAMSRELQRRGYRYAESTRAMGTTLDALPDVLLDVEVGRPPWPEYQTFLERIGAPAGLLPHVDTAALDIAMARLRDRNVATALSFDHAGDCGIFNVATIPWARRRGLGTALTALQLHGAKRRGCTTASLQSTPMAEGMYAAIGFKDLGRILEYVPSHISGLRPPLTSSSNGCSRNFSFQEAHP